MADEAYEYGDDAMFHACRALFRNITDKRMYITGGIGSSSSGEAFTKDYDLPNETAYTESCAAIGLALFARRMLRLESDSLYADTAELALYNGYLASISLDGTRFFYENPLEINLLHHGRNPSVKQEEHLPITQRVEVFDCSCCPPNIARAGGLRSGISCILTTTAGCSSISIWTARPPGKAAPEGYG